nr:F-box/kelch-repeat protein At3g23880-like isoform X2 [Quercus suber]
MSQTREPPPRRILRQNKNHLPHDIVLKILARLPVKSVLRFRCVSKTWCSSIATPNFISNHLTYHKNNNNNNNLAYLIYIPPTIFPPSNINIPIFIGGYDHAFNRISEYPIPSAFLVSYVVSAGSCNGLVCLCQVRTYSATDPAHIYLWNPSIRKVKRLPDFSLDHSRRVSSGFAYQSETNDYKVVNIYQMPASNHHGHELEAAVYTLSSNSWRRVGISVTNFFFSSPFVSSTPTFVSGVLHWLGYISEAAFHYMILTFDVNNDKFGEIALPDGQQLLPQGLMAVPNCLMVFKGKLAFITLDYRKTSGINDNEYGEFMSSHPRDSGFIWVMREYGVHESWSKLFFVKFENVEHVYFFGCTSRGELLVIKNGVYTESNAEQRQGRKVIVSLDLETLHEKDLGFQNDPLIASSFMESLVLLDGATELSG